MVKIIYFLPSLLFTFTNALPYFIVTVNEIYLMGLIYRELTTARGQ